MKRECMVIPEKLAAEGAALPAPLVHISEHLAGLAFEGEPDYQLLRGCLERLAACQAAVQARARLPARPCRRGWACHVPGFPSGAGWRFSYGRICCLVLQPLRQRKICLPAGAGGSCKGRAIAAAHACT